MEHIHWGTGVAGVGFEGGIDLRSKQSVNIKRIEMVVVAEAQIWCHDGGATKLVVGVTHGEQSNGVDGQLINFGIGHDGDGYERCDGRGRE